MTKLLVLFASIQCCSAFAQVGGVIGPTDTSCSSVYSVGYTNCAPKKPPSVAEQKTNTDAEKKQSPPTPAPTASKGTVAGAVSESDIDNFLANHGKPSRESARALLDPSDENIAAMARSLRQQSATAAYVASRMTAMQQVDPGLSPINPSFNSEDLPLLSGMRLVLHVTKGCAACERAAMVAQRLVAESPILDARVVMHGVSDTRELLLEMGRVGLTLPVTIATPALKAYAQQAPTAIVADIRNGKERTITTFTSTQDLRSAIAQLRRSSQEVGSK